MSDVVLKLSKVQEKLYAPKDKTNDFGKFSYRNAEDILRAVKPLLANEGLAVTMTDDVEIIGSRYYMKSTVSVAEAKTGESVSVTAWAREPETKKGMDDAQVTGSSTSYARKYALCGLFAIDDGTQDIDSADNRTEEQKRRDKEEQERKEQEKKQQEKKRQEQKPQPKKAPGNASKRVTVSEIKAYESLLKSKGLDPNRFTDVLFNRTVNELTKEQINATINSTGKAIAKYHQIEESRKEEILT